MGNVELFELFETDPKTQCTIILDWRHRLLHMRASLERNSFIEYTLDLLSIPEYVIEKGRLHVHRYGKTPEKKENHLPIIWKRDASKENSQGSMIVSCEIMFSVSVWSKTIEMKMFVVIGTILKNKITPIECRNQNTFTTGKVGGSLSTSPETQQNRWENVLSSTKRCLHSTVYTEKLEDDNSGPRPTGSTSNGNRHRVLPPPGGNGVNPGGLPKNSKKVN